MSKRKPKNRPMDWTDEMDALLGTMSDAKLAEQLECSRSRVRGRRERLGISAYVSPRQRKPSEQELEFEWTAEADALLGTMSDVDLAKSLGISRVKVHYRRSQLGVPIYDPPKPRSGRPRRKAYEWSEHTDRLIGTMDDTTLARRLGIPHGMVTNRRRKLGIEAYRPSVRIDWTEDMIASLGMEPDAYLAERLGVAETTIKNKRLELGIPGYGLAVADSAPDLPRHVVEQLGVRPDVHIEREFGIPRLKLRQYRLVHNIPTAKREFHRTFEWSDDSDRLLGTMSDSNLAAQLGTTRNIVATRRWKLDVPAFGSDDLIAKIRWTKKRIAMLGKQPDHFVARVLKCTQRSVTAKREELGIPPVKSYQWSDEDLARLGTVPDKELADQIGVSSSCVRSKRNDLGIEPAVKQKRIRWTAKILGRLGILPDEEIAQEFGISVSAVSVKRNELGIEPTTDTHRGVWTSSRARDMLGTKPDSEVARELGVTSSAVVQKRLSMGIPPYVPPRR